MFNPSLMYSVFVVVMMLCLGTCPIFASSVIKQQIKFQLQPAFRDFSLFLGGMKVEPFRGQQYDKISRYDNNIHAIRFQQYNKISRHHKKLGVPWTDPTFPANDSSIGLQKVLKHNL